MEPPYDPATAYHEAGHAVMAMSLGRPIRRVDVVARGNRLGTCEFQKGIIRPTQDWLEEQILILLAGMAAEARHTGADALGGASHDLRQVRRLATQRAGGRQAERYERRMLAKAENFLADDASWQAVEAIAAELLRLGTISGRAARHLYESATVER